MRNDELRKQIEALRGEVRTLSESFLNIKQEDLRTVMGEQIRPVLLEKIDHYFSDVRPGTPAAEKKMEQRAVLVDLVNEAVGAFQRRGKNEAMQFLDKRISKGLGSSATRDPRFAEFAGDLMRQIRTYYEISDHVLMPRPGVPPPEPPSAPAERALSPALVEETLAPLASAWRISILTHLSTDDESLAGLSRSLGLKKGHLQFHLNVLSGANLISYDRKSHLYSITAKGSVALEGLSKLVDALAST